MVFFCILSTLAFSSGLWAQANVSFDYTNQVFAPAGAVMADQIENLVTTSIGPQVEREVNQVFANYDFKPFLGSMANAGFNSLHGLRTDYVSDFDYFLLGLGFGLGLNLGGKTVNEVAQNGFTAETDEEFPSVGLGAALNTMVGISLRNFDIPDFYRRFDVYVNAFYLSFELPTGGNDTKTKIDNFNLGMNIQYRLIDKVSRGFGVLNMLLV